MHAGYIISVYGVLLIIIVYVSKTILSDEYVCAIDIKNMKNSPTNSASPYGVYSQVTKTSFQG